MLVLSHRGNFLEHFLDATPKAPAPPESGLLENSLQAFTHCIGRGVRGIETDIRTSADGAAILFHNRFIRDGAGREHEVASLSLEELRRLRPTIPTLAEALSAARPDVYWNLELKTFSAFDAAAEAVERYARTRRFLVTSFLHPLVERFADEFAEIFDSVDCGILVAHRPLDVEGLVPSRFRSTGRINTVVWQFDVAGRKFLERTSALGLRNLVYGPFTRKDHEKLIEWNVDGIITDFPALAMQNI